MPLKFKNDDQFEQWIQEVESKRKHESQNRRNQNTRHNYSPQHKKEFDWRLFIMILAALICFLSVVFKG